MKLSLMTRSSVAFKLVGMPFIVICHFFLLSESVGRKQRILDNQAARAAADTDADNDVPAEPPSKKRAAATINVLPNIGMKLHLNHLCPWVAAARQKAHYI